MSVAIGPTSLDWPAWVQAVGSIAAILVAVGVAHFEYRQRRREQIEDAKAKADEELAGRVRFFQMVALQLHETLCVAERIADEEQRYRFGDGDERPTLSWRSWAQLRYAEFERDCVERLRRIEQIPLSEWPDIESGLVFGDAVRGWRREFQDIKDAMEAPVPETEAAQRDLYLGAMNEVSYFASAMLVPFHRFIRIRDHAVDQAKARGIDVRYDNRHAVDRRWREERKITDAAVEDGDMKTAMHSELELAGAMRESIRPEHNR